MAEFAIAEDGHAWNNSLAHATFEDNVATHGKETALKFLRQDIRSWISERKNESHQWSLYVRDGHMMTETGVSLDEMTSNITNGPHSDLVPETIKATALLEAATLEEATRLAAMGANRIVLPEQHEDASGNIVSRYLSVWTKNASDPSRYDGSRIDLGKNIRIEDVRTGVSFTAFGLNQDIRFHQHGEEKQAFVLEVKNDGMKPFEVVEKTIITSIHRSHQETYVHDFRGDASLKNERQGMLETKQERYEVFDKTKNLDAPNPKKVYDTDLFIHVPRAVVRETVDTARGVAVFLRDKEKRKEGLDRIRRVFAGEKKDEGTTHRPNVHPERLTIDKIREKPVKIVKTIEARHVEMQQSMGALLVAAETKVTLGAVPLILVTLSKEHPKPIRSVEKSLRRHKKKELRIKEKEASDRGLTTTLSSRDPAERGVAILYKDEIASSKTPRNDISFLRSKRVESLKKGKEQKRRMKRSKENGVPPRRAAASEMIPSVSKKRERREKWLMRRAVEKSVRRRRKKELRMKNYELKKKVKREIKKDSMKARPLIETKRSIQNKEREAIAGMVFGWMAWMILTRKDSETPKNNFRRSHPAKQGETLRRQEITSWILLSIIYYLTAMREQGKGNYPMKKKRRKFPRKAVIFAFRS